MTKEEKRKLEEEIRRQCWVRDTNGLYGTDGYIPKKGYVSLEESYKFCTFYSIFNEEEHLEFLKISKNNFFVRYLDWVHIFGRGENKYSLEKTCLGNRLSHTFFDTYLNPATGKRMTKEERNVWQERLYNYIIYKSNIATLID